MLISCNMNDKEYVLSTCNNKPRAFSKVKCNNLHMLHKFKMAIPYKTIYLTWHINRRFPRKNCMVWIRIKFWIPSMYQHQIYSILYWSTDCLKLYILNRRMSMVPILQRTTCLTRPLWSLFSINTHWISTESSMCLVQLWSHPWFRSLLKSVAAGAI